MADDYEASLEAARGQAEHITNNYDDEPLSGLDAWLLKEVDELIGFLKDAEDEAGSLIDSHVERIEELEKRVEVLEAEVADASEE